MEFDGEKCDLNILSCGSPLHFCIADLCAGKDTIRILKSLHKAFPFPRSSNGNVGIDDCDAGKLFMHEYINSNLIRCENAVSAIDRGDLNLLARCMTEAQDSFDAAGMLMCPSELKSPRLHEIISDPILRDCGALAVKGSEAKVMGVFKCCVVQKKLNRKF